MTKFVNQLTTYLLILCCLVLAVPASSAQAIDSLSAQSEPDYTASDDDVALDDESTENIAVDSDDLQSQIEETNLTEADTADQSDSEAPPEDSVDTDQADEGPIPDESEADGDETLPPVEPVYLLISKVQVSSSLSPKEEFIELYNPSDDPVEVSGVNVEFLTASHDGSSEPTRLLAILDGVTIDGQGYYILASPGYLADQVDAVFAGAGHGTSGHLATNGSVRLMQAGVVLDLVGWGNASQYEGDAIGATTIAEDLPVERCVDDLGLLVDTGDNQADFALYQHADGGVLLRQSALCPVEEPDPEPTNPCAGLMVSEIGANLSQQFIEIYNGSESAVELAGCKLMTNRNSKSFTFTDSLLSPGQFKNIFIEDTELTLTKTTNGTVYLLSEDEQTEVDSVSYHDLKTDTAWALFDDGWKQTYRPTPGAANYYQQFLPCEAGYLRNLDTGRCNKLAVENGPAPCADNQFRNPATGRCKLIDDGSDLQPCRQGQYRHPQTNRCRNLAVTANTLTPCRPGQERNPATNRCRAIAASSSSLKPCQEGWERNPETNRCRKVASTAALADVDFPVEPISDVAQSFVGWWALGGVLMLGLGYAGWEWRHEIFNLLRHPKQP